MGSYCSQICDILGRRDDEPRLWQETELAQPTPSSGSSAAETKPSKSAEKRNQRDKGHNDLKALAQKESKEYNETIKFLSQVPLFQKLPKHLLPLLAASGTQTRFTPGDIVIKQGDNGSEFFVIRTGTAIVTVHGKLEAEVVATFGSGDYFGEAALLWDVPRTATITAETELVTLKISRANFEDVGLNNNIKWAKRNAVGQGRHDLLMAKPPSPKTPDERALIHAALRKNENLHSISTLDERRLEQLADVAWKETVVAGKDIITAGDLVADFFYIVQAGKFEVVDHNDLRIEKGGSFGELALLYLAPRAVTVRAIVDSVVWVIDRTSFKNIIMKVSDEKLEDYMECLNNVEILRSLHHDDRRTIAAALVEMHFVKDEAILEQYEPGNTFYVLYDGEVSVLADGEEKKRMTASKALGVAHTFGEQALLNNEVRTATVLVTSETAKVLAMDRESFNLLLGPLEDILRQDGGGPRKPVGCRLDPRKSVMPAKDRNKISKKDLVKISLLGCGAFGAVDLVENKKTKETFALKMVSKGYIVKMNMKDCIMYERNVLMMTNSPFVIKLHECFNETQCLYFLMEAALGGELYATYNSKGFYGSADHCRFYVAGVIFAIEHLHERRIVYRDLKPENVLLTSTGHPKLTDMGLAKFVVGKTYTTCGTPDYFAPEVISCEGHTHAVDWWAVGVLIFELMTGHPPFSSNITMKVFANVQKGIGAVRFPPDCQGPPADLVKGLLRKDTSERLAMRPGGVSNVKEHAFYHGFDWDAFANFRLEPPYQPAVKDHRDVTNFSPNEDDLPEMVTFRDDGSGWDREFAT